MKLSLIILLACFQTTGWAAKRALVVGGSTEAIEKPRGDSTPRLHEFARVTGRTSEGLKAQGYAVTTLFDNTGLSVSENADDTLNMKGPAFVRDEMKRDYDKLSSLGAKAASEQSILKALQDVHDSSNPGDEFEFHVSAHGYRFCGGKPNPEPTTLDASANNDPNCVHKLALSGADGRVTYVETSKIVDKLRLIDAKGIKTNVNLISCYSGQTQDLFRGMNNTCTTLLASGNNWGMGCMPGDVGNDPGYMSSLDAVNTAQWIGIADKLQADAYYRDDPCTQKLLKHFRENGIKGENRYDLFMSGRRFDGAPHEPSISSQFNEEYFRNGRFSALLINALRGETHLICRQPLILKTIEDLAQEVLRIGDQVAQERFDSARKRLIAQMKKYDSLIPTQRQLLQDIKKEKDIISPPSENPANLEMKYGLSATQVEGVNPPPTGQAAPKLQEGDSEEALKMELPADLVAEIPVVAAPTLTPEQEAAVARLQGLTAALKELQTQALDEAIKVIKEERALVEIANTSYLRARLSAEDPCLRPTEHP